MQAFRITLKPLSAYATALKGDTLLGQLCWAIRNRFGEAPLNDLLEGYTGNRPFAVLSDAFPEGYLPMPCLPECFWSRQEEGRLARAERHWLPEDALQRPLQDFWQLAQAEEQVAKQAIVGVGKLREKRVQTHNLIDRRSNQADKKGFASYGAEREWFAPGLNWTLYLVLDTTRWSLDDCRRCLQDIGRFGYGKDASRGLGKFEVMNCQTCVLPRQVGADACLTLAPCAPQGLNFDSERSFYRPFTRFGRHGDRAAHLSKPFKSPVLLAQTGAVFGVEPPSTDFIGQGLGGNGALSIALPATVQQGYAPVIGLKVTT